eukprot:856832-Pleurochrysis_carterae.AAC.1
MAQEGPRDVAGAAQQRKRGRNPRETWSEESLRCAMSRGAQPVVAACSSQGAKLGLLKGSSQQQRSTLERLVLRLLLANVRWRAARLAPPPPSASEICLC